MPYFEGEKPTILLQIAQAMEPQTIPIGHKIYSQEDDEADSLYVIFQGTVQVTWEQPMLLNTKTFVYQKELSTTDIKVPGDAFGHEEFDRISSPHARNVQMRQATATAVSQAKVFKLDYKDY